MSGHSKWSSIKHKKGAKDARRGKLFSKLIREITVAAKMGGAELDANPRLRQAVNNARAANLPQDTVMRAVTKGAGGADGVDYAEVIYEGYGPHNTAVVIEALTDNRNRTAAEIRAAFAKHGGNLGEVNSVSYLFRRAGEIRYAPAAAAAEAMFEAAIEAGAEDVDTTADGHLVFTGAARLNAVREALEASLGAAESARLVWLPATTVPVDDADADTLLRLLEALDDSDDVQLVSANYEIPDELMLRLAG